jgi:hypothetical protein
MRHFISQLFYKPKIKFDPVIYAERRRSRERDSQFADLMNIREPKQVNPDKYEISLRRRRVFTIAFIWLLVAGFSWVVIESAEALSLF